MARTSPLEMTRLCQCFLYVSKFPSVTRNRTICLATANELIVNISGVGVDRSLVVCVVFCRSLFVLFLLAIVLSVLRLTDSVYPFGIFKLFKTSLARSLFITWKVNGFSVCQWLASGRWFSPDIPFFFHQQNWPPRYDWNIVESGVKHHKQTNQLSMGVWSHRLDETDAITV
jgi:hypothetical protein